MRNNSCLYAYCIINANEKIDFTMAGKRIYSIAYRDIAMIAGSFEEGSAVNRHIDEYALMHEKIAERMMMRFTVLPMRLLTIFPSEEKVLAVLEKHYDVFMENFERLLGKAEFGLKVLWPSEKIKEGISSSAIGNPDYGTASDMSQAKSYMKEKYAKYKIEEAFLLEAKNHIEFIDKFFSGIVSEKKLMKLQTKRMLLNASYLVYHNRHDDLRYAFEKLKKARPEFYYQFSGPWPTYNFIIMKKGKSSLSECVKL